MASSPSGLFIVSSWEALSGALVPRRLFEGIACIARRLSLSTTWTEYKFSTLLQSCSIIVRRLEEGLEFSLNPSE